MTMDRTPWKNTTKSPYETALICMCVVDSLGLLDFDQTTLTAEEKRKKIPRVRSRVEDIMYELGPSACRRYYRMNEDSFWSLHQILTPFIDEVTAKRLAVKRSREKSGKDDNAEQNIGGRGTVEAGFCPPMGQYHQQHGSVWLCDILLVLTHWT